MKKWYYWLGLSLIWVLAAIFNYFDHKSIMGSIVSAVLFLLLGIGQFFCDRQGEKGKKWLNWIYAGVILLGVVFLLAAIIYAVSKG